MNERFDLIVIGAGVVGSALAYAAAAFRLNTLVLDKENDVAEGVSKANSGVIHAGFNVPPGSLKARLNVEGARELPNLCRRLSVPIVPCGKLVIATNEEERAVLQGLYRNGQQSGVRGLSLIENDTIRRLAPYVRAKWALYSRYTSVVSPYLLTIALAQSAYANGVSFRLNEEVTELCQQGPTLSLQTRSGRTYSGRVVVNAAGLQSAHLAENFDGSVQRRIFPYRGQYLVLDRKASRYANMAIYPSPPRDGKGLGVHITPTTNGAVLIGPSAEHVESVDDTSTTTQVLQSLRGEAAAIIPELKEIPAIKSYAGVRPKLVSPNNDGGFEDFYIGQSDEHPGLFHLIGIESPGLTAAPAIARYVLELAGPRLPQRKRTFIRPKTREAKSRHRPPESEILCYCQSVTRNEILRAAKNPFHAKSLTAIKKRTDAMAGQCQGQFCMPRIAKLLMDEMEVLPGDLLQDARSSHVFEGPGGL